MINKYTNNLLAIALAFQLAAPQLFAGSADGAPQSPVEVDTALGEMRISGNFAKDWNLSAKCRTVEKDVQEITVSIGSRRNYVYHEAFPSATSNTVGTPPRDAGQSPPTGASRSIPAFPEIRQYSRSWETTETTA